jgi:hypothetical protein
MKLLARISALVLALSVLLSLPAQAQEEDQGLSLSMSRDFGYRGGNRIQGRFTLTASGPQDLERVEFMLDGEIAFNDQEPPFRYQFSTGEYSLGSHRISAIGYTASGAASLSEVWEFEFVSPEAVTGEMVKLAGPIVAIILALTLIGMLGPALIGRGRKPFELGQYGSAGGGVCSRCEMPYSRHFLSLNLLIGKLERCPHCGKIAIVSRATRAELERAEQRWKQDRDHGVLRVDAEKSELERLIEESRFED